jgi:starch synthase
MLPRILMVSSESSPWAKSGGLADVVGSLPLELARTGHSVAVVIPGYGSGRDAPADRVLTGIPIPAAGRIFPVSVRALTASGVTTFFVDQPELYDRPGLYGDRKGDYPDNHIRFAVLCRAALEVSRRLFPADILHCHDWQASLLPAWIKGRTVTDPHFLGAKTLLTIHNLGYQGVFSRAIMSDIGLSPRLFTPEGFEFWGKISFLKAGIVFADVLTTVSPKYAKEIQTPEYGFGLDGLLRRRRNDLTGILNGVDYAHWNPETDALLPANYSVRDLSGKQACKRSLLEEMGFPPATANGPDTPVVGVVSRFTSQKGFDLLAEVAADLFEGAGAKIRLVALGSGEAEWEELFRDLAARYPDQVRVRFGYDERLAHRIEAGSDMFLMPSRYEPCGLNQIYSLRYGTVPVARATGGLDDTIVSIPGEAATGFKFHDYNGKALLAAVRAACALWGDQPSWKAMMVRGMQKDFSWAVSAAAYSRLYRGLYPAEGLHPVDPQATLTI